MIENLGITHLCNVKIISSIAFARFTFRTLVLLNDNSFTESICYSEICL